MTWLDGVEMNTVLVHGHHGYSWKGLKRAVHDDCLILHSAMLLGDETPQVLQGDVVIPKEQIVAIQVVAE